MYVLCYIGSLDFMKKDGMLERNLVRLEKIKNLINLNFILVFFDLCCRWNKNYNLMMVNLSNKIVFCVLVRGEGRWGGEGLFILVVEILKVSLYKWEKDILLVIWL